jgi:hypothetical protein
MKIDGKAIDVTYKSWTKIHQLIHECNDNRKNLPGCLLETSLSVVIAMHIFPTRFDSIINKLSKFAIKPWMNKEQAPFLSSTFIWTSFIFS